METNSTLSDFQLEPIAVVDAKRVTNAYWGDDLNLVWQVARDLGKNDCGIDLPLDRDGEAAGVAIVWTAVGVVDPYAGRAREPDPD